MDLETGFGQLDADFLFEINAKPAAMLALWLGDRLGIAGNAQLLMLLWLLLLLRLFSVAAAAAAVLLWLCCCCYRTADAAVLLLLLCCVTVNPPLCNI